MQESDTARTPKSASVTQTREPLFGVFRSRPNRFRMEVELEDGTMISAHCPNPGRMEELFTGGERVSLRQALLTTNTIKRVTTHDVLGVLYKDQWVSIDSRLPNALVAEALTNGPLTELAGWELDRAEYTWGSSRFDFLLRSSEGKLGLMEVKSCTLVEDGIAIFPDAPTIRGARHLRELAEAVLQGYQAWALFCIQRPDARQWQPHRKMDPDFSAACQEARDVGVGLLAYTCDFDGVTLSLRNGVPVELSV